MKPIFFKLSLPVFTLLFMVAGCDGAQTRPTLESATLLPVAKRLGDFNLTHYGEGDFNLDSIKNDWSLFFFGYARCPDVCPSELFIMAEMMRQIEQDPSKIEQNPQVVFVSVDPQQDTPKLLQEYAGYFHQSFKGVTGEQPEVDKLAQSMGAFHERVYHLDGSILTMEAGSEIPPGLENSYLINHSTSIVLTNPDGKMHAIFSVPHEPETLVRDLAAIQKAW